MDLMASILEDLVSTFTDEEGLMKFAAIYDIQDSSMVQQRLFQIRNPVYGDQFVNEELDTLLTHLGGPLTTSKQDDFELALDYVTENEEVEESIKALLFDDEIELTSRLCIQDGEFNPLSQPIPYVKSDEPRPGTSAQQDDDTVPIILDVSDRGLDNEIDLASRLCIQDGEFNPLSQPIPYVKSDEPRPGTSAQQDDDTVPLILDVSDRGLDNEIDLASRLCIQDGEFNPLSQPIPYVKSDEPRPGTSAQQDDDTVPIMLDVSDRGLDNEIDLASRLCIQDGEFNSPSQPIPYGKSAEPRPGTSAQQDDDSAPKILDVSGRGFDDEMDITAQLCLQDGKFSPQPQNIQHGGSDEPVQSHDHTLQTNETSSGLKFTIKKKSERVYAKNAAVDTTYQVKIDEQHQGQRLKNVLAGLFQMFDDILDEVRGNLADNDLVRIVIHHNGLHDPIVVPLQTWESINADTILQIIEKVLNSNQELAINESFEITVGCINLLKGGSRRQITSIRGENSSLKLKKSVITIENDDVLCMARSIAVAWAKLHRCSPEEWKTITHERGIQSNLELILKHRKVPKSHYRNILMKPNYQQKELAIAISRLAGVSITRPSTLSDISAFEKVLNIRVMVISAKHGNNFVTPHNINEQPCVYLYLVDDNHFHAISSVTGFFSSTYFCEKCLKHYNNKEKHQCETTCIVCKTTKCPKTVHIIICNKCNMTCRSQDCFDRHLIKPNVSGLDRGLAPKLSQCETWFKCKTCYKIINRNKRKIELHMCGEYLCSSCNKYVLRGHQCYLRATPYKDKSSLKFIFFDFECNQDEISECTEGYVSSTIPTCQQCHPSQLCKTCSKCKNCGSSCCGKTVHRTNFVVAHTVCKKCIHEPVQPDSICNSCGTRCKKCYNTDGDALLPCVDTCGFREVIFEGNDTANKFGNWLFSSQHRYAKAIAHNMKGYDGYFLLEYLIDQSIRPEKITYAGSKIMYMEVGKGLHIKVLDSLNFLPMKLSALPKAFGLEEVKKGWFPHFFNTKGNQHYIGPYPDLKYYGVDFMSSQEREEFLSWHKSKINDIFDFRKEMEKYCRSDVDILRQACIKFRQLLISSTATTALITTKKGVKKMKSVAIDPFDFVTVASLCMGIYKTKFLEEQWRVKMNDNSEWSPALYVDGNLQVFLNNKWIKEGELKDDEIKDKQFLKSPIAKITPFGYNDQFSKASNKAKCLWTGSRTSPEAITM